MESVSLFVLLVILILFLDKYGSVTNLNATINSMFTKDNMAYCISQLKMLALFCPIFGILWSPTQLNDLILSSSCSFSCNMSSGTSNFFPETHNIGSVR